MHETLIALMSWALRTAHLAVLIHQTTVVAASFLFSASERMREAIGSESRWCAFICATFITAWLW